MTIIRGMPPSLHVHLLPNLLPAGMLRGGTVVVIDVLRATTTMLQAFAAGAVAIIPCAEIEETQRVAQRFPAGTVLLGGERGGQAVPGFDLDNSPLTYRPKRVAGKTIVMTTTNGTRAIAAAAMADRVLIGAFANLEAVIRLLSNEAVPVHLLCAGTDGQVTLEDLLFAGAIVARLCPDGIGLGESGGPVPDDAALVARAVWESHGWSAEAILQALRGSRGGQCLLDLGYEADILFAAERDRFDFVPELRRDPWRIVCG